VDESGITLNEIALRAGTTVPTVSKVLNGRSDVSDAMRERVLALVEQSGYTRPARRARAPISGGTIDLVISGVEGSWANHALSGVEAAAAAADLDVIVTVAGKDRSDWVGRLLARRSSGAVLALVSATPRQLATLRGAGIPVVLLDPTSGPTPGVPSVGAANRAGGSAAAEHLLELGHTSIAVIGGRPDHAYSQARIDGFRSALERAGVALPEERIAHADWRRASAADATMHLLETRHPPTAIFACSDTMALGVYEACTVRGVAIPHELSVVGFDDLPEAKWVTPPLTTIRQPVTEMAAAALRMLLRLRTDRSQDTPREELATSVVTRSSTASPDGKSPRDG
jgi:LacI family transcriptional regulator